MDKALKDNFAKAQAAVVIEDMIQVVRARFDSLMIHLPEATIANVMVHTAWTKEREQFDGSKGERPHKMTLAIVSMSVGIASSIEAYKMNIESRRSRDFLILCLAMLVDLLEDVQEKKDYYHMTLNDEEIIENSAMTLDQLIEAEENKAVIDALSQYSKRLKANKKGRT